MHVRIVTTGGAYTAKRMDCLLGLFISGKILDLIECYYYFPGKGITIQMNSESHQAESLSCGSLLCL